MNLDFYGADVKILGLPAYQAVSSSRRVPAGQMTQ